MTTTIEELVKRAHCNAVSKGFYDYPIVNDAEICKRLMLIVSELSEAMEELRNGYPPDEMTMDHNNGKPLGFPSELADAMIRIADLAGWLEIDLQRAVEFKMSYNESRPHKHGRSF